MKKVTPEIIIYCWGVGYGWDGENFSFKSERKAIKFLKDNKFRKVKTVPGRYTNLFLNAHCDVELFYRKILNLKIK